jgi:RNA polymerase sigma-70 factor, ECF subfamily
VVQESFQRAFIHLNRFKGDSRFSTWVCRIVTNTALMRLRKKRAWREFSLDGPPESDRCLPQLKVKDARPNPEQLYSQKERKRILLAAIDELRPGVGRAIMLRELDGRSTEETALILGISVSAVKSRLLNGRRKLLRKLKMKLRAA